MEQNDVNAQLDPEVQEVAEEQHRHPVEGDESGHVLAKSTGAGAGAENQTVESLSQPTGSDAHKDTTQLAPTMSPLDPNAAAPERHKHSAHDADGRELTADDADYDADESYEDKETNNA